LIYNKLSIIVVEIALELVQLVVIARRLRLSVAHLDQCLVVLFRELLELPGKFVLATRRSRIIFCLLYRVAPRQFTLLLLLGLRLFHALELKGLLAARRIFFSIVVG
jgi:hypothetical protein